MKFLHTADWQIGKPFARISDPDKGAKVRNERIDTIRRIGDLARKESASFILVAGDLFDSATVDKSVVSAACSAMGQIELPVIAIPGNHDHGGPGSLWQQEFFLKECAALAPNFRILLAREAVELDDAILLPCPLLRQHESSDPSTWLREFDEIEIKSPEKPRIVLAHGSVHGFESVTDDLDEEDDAGMLNLISLDRLPRNELDYIALGDWHGTKEIDPAAWYSGTPEIDRFPKGTQNRPGHVLLVDANRKSPPEVETISTGRLGWHVVDFDFASDSDLDRLKENLKELLANRAGEDLLRLTLRGRLSLEAAARLEDFLTTLESRLLRLRIKKEFRLEPSEEEVASLANRPADPLLSRVAENLFETAEGSGEDAEIARIALRELYAACSA